MKNPNNLMVANSDHGEDDMVINTWPPQSYTCTFCKREFRSAQALGGHMNVHRRDRARLCQPPPNLMIRNPNVSSSTSSSSSTLLIQTQDLHVRNGGLCLLYSLPKHDAIFKASLNDIKVNTTPYSFNSYSLLNSGNTEGSTSTNCGISEEKVRVDKKRRKTDIIVEGIDLELRLGSSLSS